MRYKISLYQILWYIISSSLWYSIKCHSVADCNDCLRFISNGDRSDFLKCQWLKHSETKCSPGFLRFWRVAARWQSGHHWPVHHRLSMTTYWRPDWSTGKAIHCDEHGCVLLNEPTVANGNSVWEWERFNMFRSVEHRLPDSHETAIHGVPDPGLFEWLWPPVILPIQ